MPKFLLTVTSRLPTFTISNIIATAKTYGIEISFDDPQLMQGVAPPSNFVIANFNNEEEARILSQNCISVRTLCLLHCHNSQIDKFYEDCSNLEHNFNDGSFAMKVDNINKRYKDSERTSAIKRLIECLAITSKVDLKNPDKNIYLSIYYDDSKAEIPSAYYLSTYICDGNNSLPDKYSVKKRAFINTTTMESGVAFHSAVQCLSSPGKVVYDPFCGSASLLVAAAALGANILGSDYDLKSLVNPKTGTCVLDNFVQYKTQDKVIGFFRGDFLKENLDFPRMPKIDAIITDPPYGIREKCVSDSPSPLLPLLIHLYKFAAEHLSVGGRLVYWLPYPNEDFDINELPSHPCLKPVSYCKQYLMSRYSRYLLTFEKVSEEKGEVIFDCPTAKFLRIREVVFASREEFEARKKAIEEKNKV